ncbi:MAG: ABC transporter substrate-binding protein [Tissierellia bacterium]|nr:ABC transporter substrate-binding protein [Tissierellia bacterium]
MTVKTQKENDDVPLKLAHYELCIVNPDYTYDSADQIDMTGFYKIVEFTPNEKMVLVRNEDYYGQKPKIKNVIHEAISDQETRTLSILNKQADMVLHIPNESIEQLKNKEGITLYSIPASNTQTIYLNQKKPCLADKKVRQALAWGLDREELILIGTEGKSVLTTNWLSSNPQYKDIRTAVYDKYDYDKASNLLDEAGWKLNNEDRREKDGQILKIKLMTWGQDKALGEAIQSQWLRLGIDAEVQYGDYSLIEAARESGDWDASIEAWTTFGDEYGLLSAQYLPDGSGNYGGYNSDEMNKKLEELHKVSDKEEKVKLSKEISILACEDVAAIYVCPRVETVAMNSKLKGFIETFRTAENALNPNMEFED